MVCVGGSFRNANTEIHDIRFAIGQTIEACYPDLRSQWWGDSKSLHLDCWGEVVHADGHDIAVTNAPLDNGQRKLFFVNFGG